MMGRALLIVGMVATLGLIASGVVGYWIPGDPTYLQLHLLLGLVSSLLLLFSHSWILFYLIGTGKAIKDAVKANNLESELIARTREFKGRAFPVALLAMGVVMATFILGGGVYTGAIPPWIHHGLFYASLLVQGWALYRETQVLAANENLMVQINRRLAAQAEA